MESLWKSMVPVRGSGCLVFRSRIGFRFCPGQESDTESCEVSDRRRHRRLRLIGEGATSREPFRPAAGAIPREARAASWLVRDLARRIGVVQPGDPVPRAIRQQWSPLNVPLMWAAAGGDANHPVLEWLENAARRVHEPMEFHREPDHCRCSSSRGMDCPEMGSHFTGAVDRLDFSARTRVSVGNHIAARAQEFIWEEAATVDARVALLEAAFVRVTIQAGRELTAGEPSHRVPFPSHCISAESWVQLDYIDLGEAFTTRVPMLRSCPRFLRGRLRFQEVIWGVALRERSRAKLARDPVAETVVDPHVAPSQATSFWHGRT